MRSLMMDRPLLIGELLDRAARFYPGHTVATRTADGLSRIGYGEVRHRAGQLARALDRLGLEASARVGTFAWNPSRHLELYFGVPASGRVLHTLNIRLSPEQVAGIVNHAEDEAIFVDVALLPLMEKIAPLCPTVRRYVI